MFLRIAINVALMARTIFGCEFCKKKFDTKFPKISRQVMAFKYFYYYFGKMSYPVYNYLFQILSLLTPTSLAA